MPGFVILLPIFSRKRQPNSKTMLSFPGLPDNIMFIQSDGITVDLQRHQVYHNEQKLDVSGLNYRLLVTLLVNPNKVLSSSELAEQVWKKNYVSDETLAQRVSLLRKAIHDQDKSRIASIRGEGYCWQPQVTYPDQDARYPRGAYQHTNTVKPLLASKIAYLALLLTVLSLASFWLLQGTNSPTKSGTELQQGSTENALLLRRAFDYANQNNASGNLLASNLFRDILNQAPEHEEALRGLARILIQRVAKFNGPVELLEEADAISQHLLQKSNENWQDLWLRGYYFDVLGDLDQAIFHYEQVLNSGQQAKLRVVGPLAYLYVRKGRLHEAMHLNLLALQGGGQYKILQIAELLYLANIEPVAGKWLAAAYQLAPDDNFTVAQYAKWLIVNGEHKLARAILSELSALGTLNEDSLILLSLIAMQQQNWQQAKVHLDAAIALQPDSLYSNSLWYWLHKVALAQDVDFVLETQLTRQNWPNLYIARSIVEIADGQTEKALDSIELAHSLGFLDHQYIALIPAFSALAENARYQQILSDMRHSSQVEQSKIDSLELPSINELMRGESL